MDFRYYWHDRRCSSNSLTLCVEHISNWDMRVRRWGSVNQYMVEKGSIVVGWDASPDASLLASSLFFLRIRFSVILMIYSDQWMYRTVPLQSDFLGINNLPHHHQPPNSPSSQTLPSHPPVAHTSTPYVTPKRAYPITEYLGLTRHLCSFSSRLLLFHLIFLHPHHITTPVFHHNPQPTP